MIWHDTSILLYSIILLWSTVSNNDKVVGLAYKYGRFKAKKNLIVRRKITQTKKSNSSDVVIINRRTMFEKSLILSTTSFLVNTNKIPVVYASSAVLPEINEIESAIPDSWPEDSDESPPFDKSDFARLDSKPDSLFYSEARFVEHVDENAVRLMQEFIEGNCLKENDSVLDVGASWTSHISSDLVKKKNLDVVGLGMNQSELDKNEALSRSVVLDLNMSPPPMLPFDSQRFDVVLCQLSIDYFVHPLELMREVSRVLKPGGSVFVLFSNRLFISKAVGVWTGSDDVDHAYTVGSYMHYCGRAAGEEELFVNIQAKDLSTRNKKGKVVGDPLYVVSAKRYGGVK